MSDLEALMWRLGRSGPGLASTMGLVVALDGPLDASRLRVRMDAVTAAIPRLRERVRPGPLAMVPPSWEPDPAFSVERQLTVVGGSLDIMGLASDVLAAPLPEDRPPWRVVAVPSLPGGRSGLILQLHHSYTDGLGGVALVGSVFDLSPVASPPPPAPPAPPPRVGVLADLQAEAARSAALLGRVVPWSFSGALRPSQRAPGIEAAVRSAIGQMGAVSSPPSRLLAGRSPLVSAHALELSLPALKAAGRKGRGTVNDLFVSGLLEALGAYHDKHGQPVRSLRVGIPISARPGDTASFEMRNQLLAAVIRAPVGQLDFEERGRLVHEMVEHARRQPWVAMVDELAGLALRAPGVERLLLPLMRSMDLLASNVAGPPLPLYLDGARVVQMVPVGPRSGAALNVTLMSYCDRAWVGVNMDPAAVTDPESLLDRLEAAFTEFLP